MEAMSEYVYGPAPGELRPDAVIQLFVDASPDDWTRDADMEDCEVYGLKQNLLVSLWRRDDGKYDLRYGYQSVAIVGDIGSGRVDRAPLTIRPVG